MLPTWQAFDIKVVEMGKHLAHSAAVALTLALLLAGLSGEHRPARHASGATLPQQQTRFFLRPAGSFGGDISTVTLDSTHGYAGQGNTLTIFARGTPTTPTARLPLPDLIRDIYLDEGRDLAFVATGKQGVQIVDISIPAAPTLVGTIRTASSTAIGSLQGAATAVEVAGTTAYIATTGPDGLHIVDVSTPNLPTRLNTTTPFTLYNASALQLAGNMAYISANFGGGLKVVDVSTPTSPTLVGENTRLDYSLDVQVVGSRAYIAAGNDGLAVLDVSTPANPTVETSLSLHGKATALRVIGPLAYVAAAEGGLHTLDVRDPTSPTVQSTRSLPGSATDIYAATGDTLAYVAAAEGGLHLLDVSDPQHPAPREGRLKTLSNAEDIQIVGNTAYVATGNEGLNIVSLADPLGPVVQGTLEGKSDMLALDVISTTAYVAAGLQGIQVIDVSDPTSPTVQSTRNLPGITTDVQGATGGSGETLAYAAAGTSGLHVLDVSTPLSPTLRSSYDTPGSALAVELVGTYACVADRDSLLILDTATMTPTLLGSLPLPEGANARGLQAQGNMLYVADSGQEEGGLKLVDISNPTNPTLVASVSFPAPAAATAVHITGNLAYVATRSGGVYLVDVSNPASPLIHSSYDTPGSAHALQRSGAYLYVADYDGGIQILTLVEGMVGAYLPLVLKR